MSQISSVCVPQGFVANGIYCGIKSSKKNDLALIYSEVPARVAAVFTKNAVKAAHILIDQKHLKRSNKCQAIIINSGNANCANGKNGIIDAENVCSSLSRILGVKKNQVLIASTGIIGRKLPIDKIKKALIPLALGLNRYNAQPAALGIMTTDTYPKEESLSFKLGGCLINFGGIAKGVGMVHPNLATMLSFITTDANITSNLLKQALKKAVDNSFNQISVDGCMSTNDTVIILANALAGNKIINSEKTKEFGIFYNNLETICLKLAKRLIKDAEGATKFITIRVQNANDKGQANMIAKAIATSTLVKTAIFGSNPNWGRILSAAGQVCPALNLNKVSIILNKQKVFSQGRPLIFSKDLFKPKEIMIIVDLSLGSESSVIYTSDLSLEYVKINAEYN